MVDLLTAIQIACVVLLAIGAPAYAVLRLYWRAVAAEEQLRNERLKTSRLEREVRQLQEALAEAQSGAATFKEALALHMAAMKSKGASYLFESSWKRRYSDRGVRKLLARYAAAAGLDQTISPHMLRHYLLTWLKKQGLLMR
jgi:site-specific recombinase XerD